MKWDLEELEEVDMEDMEVLKALNNFQIEKESLIKQIILKC